MPATSPNNALGLLSETRDAAVILHQQHGFLPSSMSMLRVKRFQHQRPFEPLVAILTQLFYE